MIPAGLVLAGGLATRMGGGDKVMIRLAGRTLLAHILERLADQAAPILLNANGDPARFGMPVIADTLPGHLGPLAGVLAGLEHLAGLSPEVLTIPGDTPFIPRDLVYRLTQQRDAEGADIAVATSAGRMHPTVALWPVRLAPALRAALLAGERRVSDFAARYRVVRVDFPADTIDPFFNINRPEDVAVAERMF